MTRRIAKKKQGWWTWERFKDLMQILSPFILLLATMWMHAHGWR